MSQYQIDLERTNDLPSLGLHVFKVMRGTEQEGPSGYPNWRYFCQIQEPGPDQGKDVMLTLVHSDSSRWKVNSFLDAIGAPPSGKATIDQFIGKTFRGEVVYDDSSGTKRATISKFLPYEGVMPTTPSAVPSQQAQFNMPAELTALGAEAEEEELPF